MTSSDVEVPGANVTLVDCAAVRRERQLTFSADYRAAYDACDTVLITNAPAEMNVAMFAWRRGLIQSRGFYLLDPNPAARTLAVPATAPTTGEHTHETTCQ